MKILIACEESQTVCKAFRAKGHEAYSCDILPCSGGHPEWHIQDDALKHLDDGWDLMIAHPPCTYLSSAGLHWNNRIADRAALTEDALAFFLQFYNAPITRIAVENPVGRVNTAFRRPDQIIEPYFFGDPQRKRTCLWLKGLPQLKATNLLRCPEPIYIDHISGKKRYFTDAIAGVSKDAKLRRSKTFQGIADAMAEQWG